MKFYSIKNRFTDSFNTPFVCENDMLAIYTVRQIVNEQENPRIIASDFSLYCVGHFDGKTGLFDVFDSPVLLVQDCSVLLVKEEKEEDCE